LAALLAELPADSWQKLPIDALRARLVKQGVPVSLSTVTPQSGNPAVG
jgi:hypothetical protein